MAYEPYGARRKADWTAELPPRDVAALADAQDAGRARIGFTGHEPLDRRGFVHMGGRVYDPRLGRFLSPDPVVSEAWSGQGWNLYSYVGNSPLSRTDPTGYCYAAGPLCQVAGGGGFTNVTQAFTSWNMSWRIPVFATSPGAGCRLASAARCGAARAADSSAAAGSSGRG
ncbi:MAG: RHS repeat-associated core domain-containing protein [Gammaproteobacteria bacterium]|nr:RHS repeat-associated core domain-containing protein [Gammaproteobacteria bacterium]